MNTILREHMQRRLDDISPKMEVAWQEYTEAETAKRPLEVICDAKRLAWMKLHQEAQFLKEHLTNAATFEEEECGKPGEVGK